MFITVAFVLATTAGQIRSAVARGMPQDDRDSRESSGMGAGAVAVCAAAVLTLVLIAAASAVCAGSKRENSDSASSASSTPKKWKGKDVAMVGGLAPQAHAPRAVLPKPIPLEDPGPTFEESVYTMTVRPMMPPDIGLRTRMDIIGYQMDTFVSANKDVLREFRMLDRAGCRVKGGQAIAQAILHPPTRREFILKAFAAPTAFHAEAAIYSDTSHPLRRFLPEMRLIVRNTDGQFQDARNTKMPPCIIMLKGLNFSLWLKRSDITKDKIYKAVLDIAWRVAEMHALGHVHRDLKPSHALYLPLKDNWTLIDFGCVSATGDELQPAFTLPYAAPEVVAAWYDKERPMTVTEALDSWSLGILAIEAVTGEPVFPYSLSMQEATDQITASYKSQLPWEKEASRDSISEALGILKDPIMGLLRREPEQRTRVADFCSVCADLLGLPYPQIDTIDPDVSKEPAGIAAVSEL